MVNEPTGTAAGATAPANTEGAVGAIDGDANPTTEPSAAPSASNAAMARLRKERDAAKRAAEETSERLAAYEAKQREADEAKLSEVERINRRIDELKAGHQRELEKARAEAATERQRRHSLLIRKALMDEAVKTFHEPDLIVDYLASKFEVVDDDEVAQVVDGIHTPVKDVVAAFAKARPRLVKADPVSGSGDRGGRPTRPGRLSPGEMKGADLEAAAEEEIRAMSGYQQQQPHR